MDTLGYFLMKNIDKEGKKETKFLLTFGVHSSQIFHPHIFRGRFVALHKMSVKVMFLHVQINSYLAHPLICARKRPIFLRKIKGRKLKGLRD